MLHKKIQYQQYSITLLRELQFFYAIYLHGTPDLNLFGKVSRSLSSGCIRLKNPVILAAWVLQGTHYNTIEKIQQLVDLKKTQSVPLGVPIAVHFSYITVWIDEDGTATFSDDPYKMDKVLKT